MKGDAHTVQVYDQAHALARSLRNSDAFRSLLQAEKTLSDQPTDWDKLHDVRQKQLELTARQLAGDKIDQEQLDAMQNMIAALLMNERIRDYLQAEEKFALLWADVQKILGNVIQESKILTADQEQEGV